MEFEAAKQKIDEKYGKFERNAGYFAYYSERVLGNKYTLEKLIEAEPTLKDKILSFFKGASTDYDDVPKLSKAAKKYYRTYKKLFDEFSARNAQSNASENAHLSTLFENNSQKMSITSMNQENMQVRDKRYTVYSNKILDTIKKAIQTKGHLDTAYNQVQISKVTPKIAQMVKAASGGLIDISSKYVALNGSDIWHEYKRHSDSVDETGRRQITITPETMQEAIMAIYDPDIVESIFTTKDNPVQRQSFAYAKQSADGHYVVVEAVGGRKNPNITPVMVLEFNSNKWNSMINSGLTLGEILYEADEEMKSALDVEYNKKNRVTAAQFASNEAIANTPRSPRFDNSISQPEQKSNTSTKKSSKQYALDIDSEGENISGAEVMSWLNKKSESDGKLDLEATVARGLPYKRGKSDLTVGELRKVIANTTHEKVYSKSDALKAVNKLSGTWGLTVKARDEIADTVWQFLNESPDIEYRQDMAHDIAEYIVAKVLMDSKTENPDALEASAWDIRTLALKESRVRTDRLSQ